MNNTIYDGSSTVIDLTQIPNQSLQLNIRRIYGLSSLLRYYITTRVRDIPYLPPVSVIIADIMSVGDIYHLS